MIKVILHDYLACMGNFNVDLLKIDKHNTLKFQDLMDSYGLIPIINEPTCIAASSASLLDLIIVCDRLHPKINNYRVIDVPLISDNDLIFQHSD